MNGEKITSLAAGTAVRVIDEADGSDGMKWYKVQISYNGMSSTGYIRSDFITLSSEDTSAGSTITDNSAQGAAGEKDGSASCGTADTWLFPHM